MNIVTWNCNGAFRKKYQPLSRFNADILIIQECEDPARSEAEYLNWAGDYLWIGKNKNKGLGIFVKGSTQITPLNWNDHGLELFLPCRINNSFNLIGVWTKNPGPRKLRYIGQLWQYLQYNKQMVDSDRIVFCGDLNSNAIWDQKHRGNSHSDVVRELEESNITSIYHESTGERHGLEKTPTQYMYRDLKKPYHLDYAFMTDSLINEKKSVIVGSTEEWLQYSDHMPLVFSIQGSADSLRTTTEQPGL